MAARGVICVGTVLFMYYGLSVSFSIAEASSW